MRHRPFSGRERERVAERRGEVKSVGSRHSRRAETRETKRESVDSSGSSPSVQPTPAGLREEEEGTAAAWHGAEEEENGRRREGRQTRVAAAERKRNFGSFGEKLGF
jgi:hypothetical protein